MFNNQVTLFSSHYMFPPDHHQVVYRYMSLLKYQKRSIFYILPQNQKVKSFL